MPIPQRNLLRLAETIRRQLVLLRQGRYGEVAHRTRDLADEFARLRRLSDLLAICLGRGWEAAAATLSDRIAQGLHSLPYQASQVEQAVEACKLPDPAVREVLADLQQADEEFEDLRFDYDGKELVVTTEPIEMEDVYLGPFEIRLRVSAIGNVRRATLVYRIVALEPRPATSNSSVTHPHVSDGRLCEGDAGAAITAALSHGRVCDFFQLVHAVLTTYNPNSPYVSLANWSGSPCYDCDCTVGQNDVYWCHACENDFCDDCISCCSRCEDSICLACLEACTVCGERVCPSCRTNCPDCGRMLCQSCLEDGQCPCIEEHPENEENENERKDDESRSAASHEDSTDNAAEQVGTETS